MDGAVKSHWVSVKGAPDGMREGDALARAWDHNRALAKQRAKAEAVQIAAVSARMAEDLIRIFDLGGMDAAEGALGAARAELVRRRRSNIEREGWIV